MALSCNPADIVKAAACFKCIPPTTAPLVKAYLLCQTAKIADPTSPCNTPSAPTSLQVLNTSNTTIKVGWKQTKNTGSFITGYKVFWGTTSGGPYTNNSGVIPTLPRNYTITGLNPGTTYFAIVVALSAVPGCQSANSNEVSGTTTGAIPLPQQANMVLWLESTDFDAVANGTALTGWLDKSPAVNNLDHTGVLLSGNPAQPTVDGATLCKGHKTVRFDGTMGIGTPNTIVPGGGTGAEMMIVFVNDADPPTNIPANANGAFFQLCSISGALQPFTDSNFYESFCANARPSFGNPATTTAGAFCCYSVTIKSDNSDLRAWVNSENFFTAGAYTFSVAARSPCTIGCWFTGVTNLFGKGNVAAAYVWKVPLSATERAQARAYITQQWGVVFP